VVKNGTQETRKGESITTNRRSRINKGGKKERRKIRTLRYTEEGTKAAYE